MRRELLLRAPLSCRARDSDHGSCPDDASLPAYGRRRSRRSRRSTKLILGTINIISCSYLLAPTKLQSTRQLYNRAQLCFVLFSFFCHGKTRKHPLTTSSHLHRSHTRKYKNKHGVCAFTPGSFKKSKRGRRTCRHASARVRTLCATRDASGTRKESPQVPYGRAFEDARLPRKHAHVHTRGYGEKKTCGTSIPGTPL